MERRKRKEDKVLPGIWGFLALHSVSLASKAPKIPALRFLEVLLYPVTRDAQLIHQPYIELITLWGWT